MSAWAQRNRDIADRWKCVGSSKIISLYLRILSDGDKCYHTGEIQRQGCRFQGLCSSRSRAETKWGQSQSRLREEGWILWGVLSDKSSLYEVQCNRPNTRLLQAVEDLRFQASCWSGGICTVDFNSQDVKIWQAIEMVERWLDPPSPQASMTPSGSANFSDCRNYNVIPPGILQSVTSKMHYNSKLWVLLQSNYNGSLFARSISISH